MVAEHSQEELLKEAEERLSFLGAAWLDARVAGKDTKEIDAKIESARLSYRKAERKIRKQDKKEESK